MSLKNRSVAGKIARAPRGVARAFRNFKDVVEIVPKGRTALAFSALAAVIIASVFIARMRKNIKKSISRQEFFRRRDSHFIVDGQMAGEHDGI